MTQKELNNIIKRYVNEQRKFINGVFKKKDAKLEKIFKEHQKEVERIYSKYIEDRYNLGDIFRIQDNRTIHKELLIIKESFQTQLYNHISSRIFHAWSISTMHTSDLFKSVYPNSLKELKSEYKAVNIAASNQFIKRDISKGRTLKGRVWLLSNQYLRDIEDTINIGINSGDSAKNIGNKLALYIQDKEAKINAISNLKDSNVKRLLESRIDNKKKVSIKRHAELLAANETNLAYRNAEQERHDNLDMIVGYELKVSNSHLEWLKKVWIPRYGSRIEVCDAMAGKYPKAWRWNGNHPNCKCYKVPILKSIEELAKDNVKLARGEEIDNKSKNTIKNIPRQAQTYIKNNFDRFNGYSNPPYWWVDNIKIINKIVKL